MTKKLHKIIKITGVFQASCGAHPASHYIGTGGPVPGYKMAAV